MVAVPAVTPVTIPVPEPAVATPVLPLVHVPPAVVPISVVDEPAHMLIVPVIGPGTALTVSI